MHIKDGDLILGMHDLDHVMGNIPELGLMLHSDFDEDASGSDAFLHILDASGEIYLNGISNEVNQDMPIRAQLESIGVKRIVIRLDPVMAGPVDLHLQP